MKFTSKTMRLLCATALAGVAATVPAMTTAAPSRSHRPMAHVAARHVMVHAGSLPPGIQRPTTERLFSVGQGELVTLPADVSDVWTSNPAVADVYVSNRRQIHLFGKESGEATIFATTASGQVLYSTNVRVSQNITSIDQMLRLAMPDAAIKVTTVGQVAVLTGTVATPDDSAQAASLVLALLNPGVDVNATGAQLKVGIVNRLRTATPLQVNLQVKIAEVSRALVKQIGTNLTSRDTSTNGFAFGVSQGRNFGSIGTQNLSGLPKLDASSIYGLPAGSISLPFDPTSGRFITQGGTEGNFNNLALGAGKTSLAFLGHLFGIDAAAALDLAENDGLVTTLAQPNLTALSGETASFLAGGEFPIPISQQLGQVTIEYKQYGVSLAFTPTVLADGRISMRVRPEVSELSSDGAVTLNGFTVPALTTRRAETTVELGSGQSFVIGGLLRNTNSNSIDKAPGLGDVPILGTLFRSNAFKRQETELMIVITPYLVRPVNANQIKLPTDGYIAPNDAERVLLGESFGGHSGQQRPVPTMAAPTTVVHGASAAAAPTPAPAARGRKPAAAASAAPGFSQ